VPNANAKANANADSARPRIGFIGWGEENAALWEALRGGPAGDAAEATLFMPGGGGAADAPLQPLPTVEALFAACDTIIVELPPDQAEQMMPLMRLSIADRHVLVLMGRAWSMDDALRHLNERKLVRCFILPFREARRPLVAFCATPFLEAEERQAFRALFAHAEQVLELADETQFEVILGLAGLVPTAFYTIIDALADGGLMMGLPRQQGLQFIGSVLLGAATSMLEGGKHPALLREEALQSEAAATGLMELESAGIRGLMMRAVRRAMESNHDHGARTTESEK
jgi:pyrroline-5-carboxylate reductase